MQDQYWPESQIWHMQAIYFKYTWRTNNTAYRLGVVRAPKVRQKHWSPKIYHHIHVFISNVKCASALWLLKQEALKLYPIKSLKGGLQLKGFWYSDPPYGSVNRQKLLYHSSPEIFCRGETIYCESMWVHSPLLVATKAALHTTSVVSSSSSCIHVYLHFLHADNPFSPITGNVKETTCLK